MREGFVSPANRGRIAVGQEPETALDLLAAYEAPVSPAWITSEEA